MLNDDCVKELMLYIEKALSESKRRRPMVKIKHVDLPGFEKSDIWAAARYIAGKGWVSVVDVETNPRETRHPKNYHIIAVTASGYDFLRACNSTWWDSVKKVGLEKALSSLSLGIDLAKRIFMP